MTRQIKFAALLTIMTLALGGLARAQWDDDDDYYQRGNGAQARQSGYQNGYRDGVKQGRHEGRENDPEDFRAPDAGQASRGYRDWMGPIWVYQNASATGIAPDSGQATTMRAVRGATATAIPITSPPSTAAAVMAAPGSVIEPTRLVFKMARQWHAKMRQEANRIIRGLADATMMRTTAIAARTATKAPIRLSMRMAIVPATSLHAAATKLFQVASRDELPGQPAARPGDGLL